MAFQTVNRSSGRNVVLFAVAAVVALFNRITPAGDTRTTPTGDTRIHY